MKVLVTGGAGFIGSHLVDALIEEGHQVMVVDDLSTGLIENLNPAAAFYQMNVTDGELASVFQQERPELVGHYAARMDVARSVTDPVLDARENILGSLNVIDNCRRFGVKKLIYASTAAVYGAAEYLPVDERHPANPISPYGASKHAVEHYLYLYGLQHGLKWVSLRCANVYGPRQSSQGESGVVAIFATQMIKGERPTIFGSGDKTRDYIYVSDVVRAALAAMERGENAIYNIGTGFQTSDRGMFEALARALGYRGSPIHAQVRPGEIYHMCFDPQRAERELGWKAQATLEDGLSQTIPYYRALAASPPGRGGSS